MHLNKLGDFAVKSISILFQNDVLLPIFYLNDKLTFPVNFVYKSVSRIFVSLREYCEMSLSIYNKLVLHHIVLSILIWFVLNRLEIHWLSINNKVIYYLLFAFYSKVIITSVCICILGSYLSLILDLKISCRNILILLQN